jgi:molecular chaperone GrpE (heat shock protein)
MVKKIHSSKTEIETILAKNVELENNYKRVLADYQNQERRFKEVQGQFVKYANAALLEKILLNLDSLEMAQRHLHDAGLEIVINQFQETLRNEGLQLIESDNQPFDPLTMDCIEVVSGEKDHVVETLAKGYLLFDKVLRPAKVKVGSGSPTVIARSEATKQSI